MIEPFHEDYVSPHQDPLDGRVMEFDWDALDAGANGDGASPEARDLGDLAEALSRILGWLVAHSQNAGEQYDRTIGRKAIALAWVVNPGLIDGAPSLAALAKDLGITRAALSAHAATVSREFGLTNRGQVHGWNRKPVKPQPVTKRVRRWPPAACGAGWIQPELNLY